MARPRKPTETLELSRAFSKNPSRKRPVPPKSPYAIGFAPANFTDAERECWNEVVKYCPAGILTGADRMSLEILSRLMAKFRSREMMTTGETGTLVTLLGKMGMSPADREKVTSTKTETPKADPFAEFSIV